MLTISWQPTAQVQSRLVFLAHDAGTETVFGGWAERLEVSPLTVVARTDGGAALPISAIRQPPAVTPTVHVCARGGLAGALELARDARSAPDLLIVLENDDIGAIPAGPPVPVSITIFTAHSADGFCAVRTAPWAGLTTRSLSFRVLAARHGGLLDADAPVPGALTRLWHSIVNSPIEAEI
jgi:hypothetical protein